MIFRKVSASEKYETPLYKKKTLDFTDYAYREAVNRLKFLLSEAYEKPQSIGYRRNEAEIEEIDSQSNYDRPSITEISKYFPSSSFNRYGGKYKEGTPIKSSVSTTSLQPVHSGKL